MKKILLLSLIIITSTLSFSQKAHFGLKGGVNFSRFTFKDNDATDYRTGFHAGILSHIHLNKQFAIQPELLYSTQGAEKISPINSKTKLDYINIPILLQYMFDNGFRLQAGPQIGFLVKAERILLGTNANAKDIYESTDIGLAAGIGYLSPSGLGIDGRYVFGISNINDASSAEVHNNLAQFGLFYMFHHTANKHTKHRN